MGSIDGPPNAVLDRCCVQAYRRWTWYIFRTWPVIRKIWDYENGVNPSSHGYQGGARGKDNPSLEALLTSSKSRLWRSDISLPKMPQCWSSIQGLSISLCFCTRGRKGSKTSTVWRLECGWETLRSGSLKGCGWSHCSANQCSKDTTYIPSTDSIPVCGGSFSYIG